MWHISIGSHHPSHDPEWRLTVALAALDGVGDPDLGQWIEHSTERPIVHVRRRLTAAEVLVSGPVEDIRGTDEEEMRMHGLMKAMSR